MDKQLQEWVESYEREERRLTDTETEQMGRYASEGSGGSDFKQAPVGTHIGRCIKIIDIGTHHGEYQGEPTVRSQVIVQFELPNETEEIMGEQKPLIVSKFYTNSLSEKANLRKDLQAWRGKAFTAEELLRFDLANILGKAAMVTVVHNEKGKAKVVGVSGLPKGISCPPAYNTAMAFWIDEWNQTAFDDLSEGFKKMIRESDEYKADHGDAAAPTVTDDIVDDIPF